MSSPCRSFAESGRVAPEAVNSCQTITHCTRDTYLFRAIDSPNEWLTLSGVCTSLRFFFAKIGVNEYFYRSPVWHVLQQLEGSLPLIGRPYNLKMGS